MRYFFKACFLRFFAAGFSVDASAVEPFFDRFADLGRFFGGIRGFNYGQTDGNKKNSGFCPFGSSRLFGGGIVLPDSERFKGNVVLCVAQGIAITAYLLSCGLLYERFKAAGIRNPTGVLSLFPYLGATFFLACLAILAVPPLMPFTGQLLIFNAVFMRTGVGAFFLLLSVVLLYAAFFKLFTRLLFGAAPERSLMPSDMLWREKVATVMFGGVFLMLSVVPDIVFGLVQKAVGG